MKEKRALTSRAREMFSLIERYQKSDMTIKSFCAQESIPYSTFQWWQHQYRQSTRTQQDADNITQDFIPLQVLPSSSSSHISHQCEVEYPNGIVVRFFGEISVKVLAELTSTKVV